MNHYSLCVECLESDPNTPVWAIGELTNDLFAICICPKGHKTLSSLMHHAPDILYMSAVQAYRKECYSESILSFTATFERTCELFFKAFGLKHGLTTEVIDKMWKEMKNQSERQYGAFCLAYCVATNSPWTADLTQVEFRNKVVHKGYIATKAEAEAYAEYITVNLNRIITVLNGDYEKECREIYFSCKEKTRPVIDKLMKEDPDLKFSATGMPSLLRWNHKDREHIRFSEVLQLASRLETKHLPK